MLQRDKPPKAMQSNRGMFQLGGGRRKRNSLYVSCLHDEGIRLLSRAIDNFLCVIRQAFPESISPI